MDKLIYRGGNVWTSKAFDDAGIKETARLMKELRSAGFKAPASLQGEPPSLTCQNETIRNRK